MCIISLTCLHPKQLQRGEGVLEKNKRNVLSTTFTLYVTLYEKNNYTYSHIVVTVY